MRYSKAHRRAIVLTEVVHVCTALLRKYGHDPEFGELVLRMGKEAYREAVELGGEGRKAEG